MKPNLPEIRLNKFYVSFFDEQGITHTVSLPCDLKEVTKRYRELLGKEGGVTQQELREAIACSSFLGLYETPTKTTTLMLEGQL